MKMDVLTKDMQLVADVIGIDAAKLLMRRLGGIYIYIPKPSREEIAEALKNNGFDKKMVAAMYGVSQKKVEGIQKELRREIREKALTRRQLTIFEEEDNNIHKTIITP